MCIVNSSPLYSRQFVALPAGAFTETVGRIANHKMWTLSDDLPAESWDELVAAEGGHPLQTALWATARAKADQTQSERLLLRRDGQTALLARVEVRQHKLAGKIAWVPQGPIFPDAQSSYEASVELKSALRERGYQLCFENPYDTEPPRYSEHGMPIGGPAQTSVVDLSIGEEASWSRLSSNWRNNIRSAERSGICVSEANDAETIKQFVAECERLSVARGFRYQGSEAFIAGLLLGSSSPTLAPSSIRASLGEADFREDCWS